MLADGLHDGLLQGLMLLTLLLPPALMLVLAGPGQASGLRWALPLASLPALLLGLALQTRGLPGAPGDPGTAVSVVLDLPALLLHTQLRADALAGTLLLLTGLAFSAAGWLAATRVQQHRRRFAMWWLATLCGLQLATLAGDVATFYTGYVTMTFAAYGLVLHERNAATQRAGRVYLVLALLGEALLLWGLLLIGARLGNAELTAVPQALQHGDARWVGALLLAGFAVKMGLVPLHVWLPLAHPVAPVPASAILSGVLVKAGLLGALRLVPDNAFGPAAVQALLVLGLVTAFYGVLVGVQQRRLKTVLAYSTVSQMGLMFTVLVLLLAPGSDRNGPLAALLALWMLHHGLNKAALFIGAGSTPAATRWHLLLLCLPALALAGLPLSSGALAKTALKQALDTAAPAAWLLPWLAISSLATSLLMLRVLQLARKDAGKAAATPAGLSVSPSACPAEGSPAPTVPLAAAGRPPLPPRPAPPHPAWVLLVLAGVVVPWALADLQGRALWPSAGQLWDGLWPLLAALALAWGLHLLQTQANARGRLLWRDGLAVPEGDLVVPAERAWAALRAGAGVMSRAMSDIYARFSGWCWRCIDAGAGLARRMNDWETPLAALPMAGLVLLCLLCSLAGLWWVSSGGS